MSDTAEVKKQLEKASYYYGESNTELEHVQNQAQKASELVKKIASLLPILGEDWSKSAQKSLLNIDRADKIISNMETGLQLMDPIHATLVTSLASYLMDARHSAKSVKEGSENLLAVVTHFPLESFRELSSQMTNDAETLENTARLSDETQQHCARAIAACQEYRDAF